MKEILPVVGKNGEIGQIELKDGEKQDSINRVKVVGIGSIEEFKAGTAKDVIEDNRYDLQRMYTRGPSGGLAGPNGEPPRQVRLELYVHREFGGKDLLPDERLQALDKLVFENGPWLFSFASRFDSRPTLERWKP